MRLVKEFIRVIEALTPYKNPWAICGGLAASIYSKLPRFTNDIDIMLIDTKEATAKNVASEIIQSLGYQNIIGSVPDFQQPEKQVTGLICARDESSDRFVGIDFLLPVLPWVPDGVSNAQTNLIDYGFGAIPTITPEDLIIAKKIAGRPVDLQDIQNIISSHKLNYEYLQSKFTYYNLKYDL